MKSRIPEIDIFRGIAVLLVIYLHVEYFSDWYAPLLPVAIRRLIAHTAINGWIGVDLFFVLSGFLISGLLFSEFTRTGRITCVRFLIRRGLKIYPAFYVMIAITIIVKIVTRSEMPPGRILAELFYVQNYFPGLWGHTWSLAVEEHFYIALPLFLLTLMALRPDSRNPFRQLPLLFVALFALALTLRMIYLRNGVTPEKHWVARFESHYRFDALLFGVLLCYLSTFRADELARFLKRWPGLQVTIAIVLIIVPLYFNVLTSFFSNTVGYTFIYIGCGMLLVHTLAWSSPLKTAAIRCLQPIARIGEYSYSIYLWHVPMREVARTVTQSLRLTDAASALASVLIYLVGSIGGGILMAKLIEMPVLRLRDRVFPSRSGNVPI